MQMYLLLNEDCNLNCAFCIRGQCPTGSYLHFETLHRVLQENDFHDYYLLLTGGEPVLHPLFPEIIDLCQPYFKGISVNTNGMDSLWVDQCKTHQFHVQISLDGTPTVHNHLRGNGTLDVFSRIQNTIKTLNDNHIGYCISTTVGRSNYDNMKSLCSFIQSLPLIRYWKVSPLLPFGCAKEADVLSVPQWNELVAYLLENAEVQLQIKRLFDFGLLDKYMEKKTDLRRLPKANCGNVTYKIYVYPDFTVYPCTCLTDYPLGNLKENSLAEILNNPKSAMFSDYKVKEDSVCYQCKYLSVCNGGCIGMSYHYFKELGRGDFRCPLIQEKLRTI